MSKSENPCNKCLVKACCNFDQTKCKELNDYITKLINPSGKPLTEWGGKTNDK